MCCENKSLIPPGGRLDPGLRHGSSLPLSHMPRPESSIVEEWGSFRLLDIWVEKFEEEAIWIIECEILSVQ